MKQPNWNEAPEGTTHWAPNTGEWITHFTDEWYRWRNSDQMWEPCDRPAVLIGRETAHRPDVPEDLGRNKYQREIKPGVWVDVYDVLNAFDPGNRNAADDHAIKKMLLPGKRGHKDGKKDRQEAIQSLQRSIELLGE